MNIEELREWPAEDFQANLLHWYEENKRDLPWRRERDPYKIWVSEIMLQQTKVDTVIPYYERFISLFPSAKALAEAEEETVLKAWEGLGYYSRARNLHAAVKEVNEVYGGMVPNNKAEISRLRGVGPYTAGAILSIAYNIPAPAVDGNVMRVVTRLLLMYDDISKVTTRKKIEAIIEQIISEQHPSEFNQALMELGALICTPRNPACLICPVQLQCRAREEGVQETLPVKAKKAKPKQKNMLALVVKNKAGQVLIQKRPETGLLANLWQFPNVEADNIEAIVNYMKETAQLEVDVNVTVKQHVKHVFTHLIWEIDVYSGEVGEWGEETDLESSSFKFVDKEDIDWYPFPVSHQKIIDRMVKGEE
ncbi:A/G-specific adenine glycosylase [Evansella cellulosilytica]|uniref:Adenine DNA glycosylase n=1 Tax=Evansella cellulosilytica (strain ATCC 21833 / DSM 2522 / FERM P-1141 / JCM 9156 / N-4) TaxID=649639 RepID=E6U1Z7_EVAC2|nr:A/G-specific adenine glycosylase [Evansella cellulosilytica]ADU29241.1 A/G-specific adenine glycosylase [Evansella cellulosilytica DSM 2522]